MDKSVKFASCEGGQEGAKEKSFICGSVFSFMAQLSRFVLCPEKTGERAHFRRRMNLWRDKTGVLVFAPAFVRRLRRDKG